MGVIRAALRAELPYLGQLVLVLRRLVLVLMFVSVLMFVRARRRERRHGGEREDERRYVGAFLSASLLVRSGIDSGCFKGFLPPAIPPGSAEGNRGAGTRGADSPRVT
jgi:hypothetical protein